MKVFRQKLFKVVACGLIALQLMCTTGGLTYARPNQKKEMQDNGTVVVDEDKTVLDREKTLAKGNAKKEKKQEKKHLIKTNVKKKKAKKGESFEIGYNVEDGKSATYRYETKNVDIVNKKPSHNGFEAVTKEEGFGYIDISAKYEDGEEMTTSIYTYTEGEQVYISDVSEDTAWNDCMQEKLELEQITEDEYKEAYAEFSKRYYEECNNTEDTGVALFARSNATTVMGTLSWRLADGTTLPLRNTKVELWDQDPVGAELIGTTYTNDSGYYSFTFDNSDEWYELESGGIDAFIVWYPASTTYAVTMDFGLLQYALVSSVTENMQSGTTNQKSYIVSYNEASNVTKAFYLQQLMGMGQKYAQDMGMKTNNFIHVMYPFGTEDMMDTVNDFVNEIYPVGDMFKGMKFTSTDAFCFGQVDGQFISCMGKDVFNDVDTVIHEYGHFVEHTMGTYGISIKEMAENSPVHYFDTDHFEDKPKSKAFAMKLTWSEAWATIFSQVAQEYYIEKNPYETGYKKIPNIADIYEDASDLECIDISKNSCEAQEYAVAGFLWDIFDDSGSSESFDNIAMGYNNWWNRTAVNGIYTLHQFMNYISCVSSTYKNQMSSILSEYQIAPGKPYTANTTTFTKSSIPTIKWRINGSKANPNNMFRVVFYDAYGNWICASPYIHSLGAYYTDYAYTVQQNVWNKIISNYGGTAIIYYEVEGYNTTEFNSGPYTTSRQSFKLVINDNVKLSASDRYVEREIKLDKEGCFDYTVTFANAGYRLIQTFGTKDTKIEIYSANGTLLTSDDDSGYGLNALKSYYFAANTRYRIRVKFYSGSVYGTTKLAITPSNGQYSTSTLSSYEGIYSISGRTSFSSKLYAEPNSTKIMTFTPSSAGSYTFKIDSSADTYIYVIDPRTNTTLIRGQHYDDDSGEGLNPLLTTNLTAGIPYLIIYSTYNPGSLTSRVDLTLAVKKN